MKHKRVRRTLAEKEQIDAGTRTTPTTAAISCLKLSSNMYAVGAKAPGTPPNSQCQNDPMHANTCQRQKRTLKAGKNKLLRHPLRKTKHLDDKNKWHQSATDKTESKKRHLKNGKKKHNMKKKMKT